jgi:hydroxymethylpyrimidine pyrophosphatase-like HAD family hydrolase
MNAPAYRGIFVSDLDGTLRRGGRISPDDLEAFAGLRDHGVLRVIATGRSLHSAASCLPEDFPVDYVILSTGNQIVHWPTREVLRSSYLFGREIQDICLFLRTLGVSFMVHDVFPDNHGFTFSRGAKRVEDFERRLALHAEHARESGVCDDEACASQVLAIVDAADVGICSGIARELDGLSVIRATSPLDGSSVWIEIFAAGVCKSAGVRDIVQRHGLQNALLAAIGNDHNDRDMLDMAHVPFKVENSFLDGENRYLTAPDTTDAVARAIAHYMEMLQAGIGHQ